MEVRDITVIGGRGKRGQKENVASVRFEMGDIISVVGPTGSGKTALINDIELFAAGDTPTGRTVLINGQTPPPDRVDDPSKNPIALITQHTNFLSDLPVRKFLQIHASIRSSSSNGNVVEETMDFANQLTGEPIIEDSVMTELSGGQTRALLIADAVVIGNSPILLLDEIENAGINRIRALELLKNYRKIFIFVTHDPRIALCSDFRIVMRSGAMEKLIRAGDGEREVVEEIRKVDDLLLKFRRMLWEGEEITPEDFEKAMGFARFKPRGQA